MPPEAPSHVAPTPLCLEGAGGARTFQTPFTVGREAACDVTLDSARVSRRHLEVRPEAGAWWLVDLGSANGTFIGGERVQRAEVAGTVEVQVGQGGPFLRLSADGTPDLGASRGKAAPEADGPLGLPPPGFHAAPEDPEVDPFRPVAPAPQAGVPPVSPPAGPSPPAPPPREPKPPAPPASSGDGEVSYDAVVERYFGGDPDDENVGERTKFIRRAYDDIQKTQAATQAKERSRYRGLIVAALVVSVIALTYAGFLQYRAVQYRAQAQELFYQLKSYEVNIAQQVGSLQAQIEADAENADSLAVDLDRALEARRQTAARYNRFIRDLGVYDGLSSQEEAIYKTARAFGESELTIPPEFVDEVMVQVNYWKNGGRFERAVRHAQANGFDVDAVNALRRNGMPTEFFYLSLQESDFNTRAVGPPTRYGHAKGAWQFIPETGKRYGLEPGPLVATNQYDPLDERHDFSLAANAAARYLHDIYVHLAQASGLLVCASYNWGEGRVRQNMDQIRRSAMSGIANDPEHRTYWKFLTVYRNRMPQETRDYVMKIFAAAVVGQNPRMFGIDMDPPVQVALAGGRGGIRTDAPASGRAVRLGRDALERRQSDAD